MKSRDNQTNDRYSVEVWIYMLIYAEVEINVIILLKNIFPPSHNN